MENLSLIKKTIKNTNKNNQSLLSELNFFERLEQFNLKQINDLNANNIIRKNFNATFVDQYIGNIPIFLAYHHLYNPNIECNFLEKHKNFILSLKEIRNDYDISFINHNQEIPDYYKDPFNYTTNLLNNFNKDELNEFLDLLHLNFPRVISYEYKYTHPVANKKFMGPSKLFMHDKYRIIFVSPICLVIEIDSYISGFMFMDSFYNTSQYKFETKFEYDEEKYKFVYDTKATFSFAINFLKDSWLKGNIESGGLAENKEYMQKFIFEKVKSVLEKAAFEYEEILNRVNITNTDSKVNCDDFSYFQLRSSNILKWDNIYDKLPILNQDYFLKNNLYKLLYFTILITAISNFFFNNQCLMYILIFLIITINVNIMNQIININSLIKKLNYSN